MSSVLIGISFFLAYEFEDLLARGMVNKQAEIARRYGLSRTRVTQVMNLLKLADEVREYVLSLPPDVQRLYLGRRLAAIVGLGSEQARVKALEQLLKALSGVAAASRRTQTA